MYNKDVKKYGDLADLGVHTYMPMELDKWQLAIQKQAKNIEPPAFKSENGNKEGNEGYSKKHAHVVKTPSIDLSLTVASTSATANS